MQIIKIIIYYIIFRELCIQIAEQFEALGVAISLKTVVIVGGLDPMAQAIALSKKPHISLLKLL